MSNETKQHIHDKINEKAQEYESATQHEGLGPAIFKDGVAYAMAYAKVEAAKSLQKEHQELKAKADRYEKALKRIAEYSKTSEEDIGEADAAYGYDVIIERAREALTPNPTTDEH